MSEELESLERIKKINYYEDDEVIDDDCFGIGKDLDIIENALKDYEWLKSVISVDMFDQMPTPEDKVRFLKIMGVEL